jgi:hypothetical protein
MSRPSKNHLKPFDMIDFFPSAIFFKKHVGNDVPASADSEM